MPATPSKVGIALDQTPTFNLTLGFEVGFTLLEIFSASESYDISITKLLDIQIQLGTYNNTLSNTIGSPTIVADLGLEYDVALA